MLRTLLRALRTRWAALFHRRPRTPLTATIWVLVGTRPNDGRWWSQWWVVCSDGTQRSRQVSASTEPAARLLAELEADREAQRRGCATPCPVRYGAPRFDAEVARG